MNTTPLPQTPVATRLNAVIAAAVVTLTMLLAIDKLAATDASAALVAQQSASRPV